MLVLPRTPLVASSLTGLVLVMLGLVGLVGAGPGLLVLLLGTLLLTLPSEPTETAWRAVAERTSLVVGVGAVALLLAGLGVANLVAGSGSGRVVGLGLAVGAGLVTWWVWWFRTQAPAAPVEERVPDRVDAGLARSGS